MNNGFMNLHRQLLDWEWFDNSQMVHLWIYFLLKANYQDSKWHGIDIPRGSFATSLDGISKDTKLSISVIRSCINKMKKSGELTIKSTNKFSIITICKYELYNQTKNQVDKQVDKQIANKKQTNSKQIATSNNNNNINNINNKEDNICDANASLSSGDDANADFDYEEFISFFNETLDKYKSVIPRVRLLDDRRKSVIHARIVTFGKDALYEVVEKAAKSLFLNGGGRTGWKAKFDWLFGPVNFKKVYEGNYDNDKQMGMEIGVILKDGNNGKYDNMELWN